MRIQMPNRRQHDAGLLTDAGAGDPLLRETARAVDRSAADQRTPRGGHRTTGVLAALVVTALAALAPATSASASDWGGYNDPSSPGCSDTDLVDERTVYTDTGVRAGLLQIKYSNSCPGNYARFQSAAGPAQTVALSIHSQDGWRNQAGADETGASTVFTRIIQLNSPDDTVCVYLDATYYSYGKASASFCA